MLILIDVITKLRSILKKKTDFDHVIIAVRTDEVLGLLNDASINEINTFNTWKYSNSKTYLHTDESVMPSIKNVWSSWNFSKNNK